MRENCILNCDSPSYPPETEEYIQCGCKDCRAVLVHRGLRYSVGIDWGKGESYSEEVKVMNETQRVLKVHSIKEISQRLSEERLWLLSRVESVVGETIQFSQSAANAIGDISTQEAINGIIEFFSEQMRKVK